MPTTIEGMEKKEWQKLKSWFLSFFKAFNIKDEKTNNYIQLYGTRNRTIHYAKKLLNKNKRESKSMTRKSVTQEYDPLT